MGWFSKERLKLESVAPDLCREVLQSIAPNELEKIISVGVRPDDPKHRLEIVILSLFCLRSSISYALERDKGNTLLLYIEQLLKISYVDALKLGTTDQFETVLHKRYEEYDKLDSPGATIPGTSVVSERSELRIGLRFSQNIGIDDMAIVHWAEMNFKKVSLLYVDFLKKISEKFELVD